MEKHHKKKKWLKSITISSVSLQLVDSVTNWLLLVVG